MTVREHTPESDPCLVLSECLILLYPSFTQDYVHTLVIHTHTHTHTHTYESGRTYLSGDLLSSLINQSIHYVGLIVTRLSRAIRGLPFSLHHPISGD